LSVKIRLQRIGKPKEPHYRVVVTDSRRHGLSKPIEYLGNYNPLLQGTACKIDEERLAYWLKVGAQPTVRVGSILKQLKKSQLAPQGSGKEAGA
jgi:small subunit ribosomal protein S16